MKRYDKAKHLTKVSRITHEDFEKLSGPEVWPSLSALEPRDRYIFNRPEIPYLMGLREAEANEEQLERVKVELQINRRQNNGRTRIENMGSFVHCIDPDSSVDDVRNLLQELRHYLIRTMPEKPLPGTTLRLRFLKPDNRKYISTFVAPWV